MCEKASELRDAIEKFSVGFDAALLSPVAAANAVRDMAAIEKMAATVKRLAAARVAETDVWKGDGSRSVVHHLARLSGTTVSAAAEALEAARRMQDQPVLADAARRGVVSAEQVSAISDAVLANPAAEEALVSLAERVSLRELRDECARAKAVGVDPEERRRRIHARRSTRIYTDRDGVGHLVWSDNPERIAEFMASLTPLRDRLMSNARKLGARESVEAYAADAMVELARQAWMGMGASASMSRRARRGWASAKIIVRVDFDTLLRGYPTDGEVCEIVGFGPVAVSAVQDMIATGDPFLAALATRGSQILGVAHLGRRPTAKQQTALEWLYPACGVEGCYELARLETDHRVDWSQIHLTVFDLLDRACSYHHFLKTAYNWAFVEGSGKRPFVPPWDPRHPKHQPREEDPP